MLDLLKEYGVSPKIFRIIRTYRDRLAMVVNVGGYLGRSFKGYRGVTQGDPLSPMIFNVVVDAVIQH